MTCSTLITFSSVQRPALDRFPWSSARGAVFGCRSSEKFAACGTQWTKVRTVVMHYIGSGAHAATRDALELIENGGEQVLCLPLCMIPAAALCESTQLCEAFVVGLSDLKKLVIRENRQRSFAAKAVVPLHWSSRRSNVTWKACHRPLRVREVRQPKAGPLLGQSVTVPAAALRGVERLIGEVDELLLLGAVLRSDAGDAEAERDVR
jgi:hypothetical protein